MVFGFFTRGEFGLVVFVFVLIYAAQIVPRIGEQIGAWAGRKRQ
jgi:hypothetical protein